MTVTLFAATGLPHRMSGCLFCKIAAGEIPSSRVFDDSRVFAFLDINPLRRGHVLVVPKAHAERLQDAADEDLAAMAAATKRITAALAGLTGEPDATIGINNGPSAGQEGPHLHWHIVPRDADDGVGPIHALFGERPDVPEDDRQLLAAQLRDALGTAEL